MCGLIGYVGNEQAAPVVFQGLARLEYRGYDSAGIATVANDKLYTAKDKGMLKTVLEKCDLQSLPGEIGIGHVRWATHGGVTRENAHPHYDNQNQIAVVHNGIIVNYSDIRSRLLSDFNFSSQTDTEVIPHLIRYYMNTGLSFEEAFFKMTDTLEGSFAILAVHAYEPGKILAARKESPLVIGVGEQSNYIGSDILSFLPNTNKYITIDDDEKVIITKDKIRIFNHGTKEIIRKPEIASWNWTEGSKGNYDHFMIKEIEEQPQTIRQALMQDKELITQMASELKKAKKLVFVACGTSRHAALIGRYAFSKMGHIFSDVVMGSEFGYFTDSVDENTIVIAISQSGETADVMDGVRLAKEKGAKIFSIVNVVSSSLARASDRMLNMNCGPEIGVAATKSFTSQLCLLYQLAFAMDDKLNEVQDQLREISNIVSTDLNLYLDSIPDLVNKLKDEQNFYFIARGVNFAIASEGALKLKEIAYVHAEGMPAGELKHGSLALIEDGTPVVAICPTDYTYGDVLTNVMEAKARGAHIIGVSNSKSKIFDDCITISSCNEILYPVLAIIPLQLLAYYSATMRGFDPDKPRNLAKSVTVK